MDVQKELSSHQKKIENDDIYDDGRTYDEVWNDEYEVLKEIFGNEIKIEHILSEKENNSNNSINKTRTFSIMIQSSTFKERINEQETEIREKIKNLRQEIDDLRTGKNNESMGFAYYDRWQEITNKDKRVHELERRIKIIERDRTNNGMKLSFRIPERYPHNPPSISVIRAKSLSINDIDTINHHISQYMDERLSMDNMIFDIIMQVTDIYERILAEKIKLSIVKNFSEISIDYQNIGLVVDKTTPSRYVGNIYSIIESFPDNVVVKNVENVMRTDQAMRFESYRRYLKTKYPKSEGNNNKKKNYHKVQVAYHGTKKYNLDGIVRDGLVVPDQSSTVSHATGTRYGRGIYVSSNPGFSMHYTRGDRKLLVLAVLPGRKYQCEENMWNSTLVDGYDSHVDAQSEEGNEEEIVLFEAAQALACYVIHYNYLHDEERSRVNQFKQLTINDPNELLPGETEDQKIERLTALAESQLGYGFGTVSCESGRRKMKVIWVGTPRSLGIYEHMASLENAQLDEFQFSRYQGDWNT